MFGGRTIHGDKFLPEQCETPVLLTEKLNCEDSNSFACISCYSTFMKSFFLFYWNDMTFWKNARIFLVRTALDK
jgi:hypothetical protein